MQTADETQTPAAQTPDQTDERRPGQTGGTGEGNANGNGEREVILSVKDLTVAFGSNVVLDALNLDIYRGEILGFVGPSGTGKSVLMRTVLRLLPRRSGKIEILGAEYDAVSEEERVELDTRLGVLFQHGALFSSLTVKENIQVPMREYLDLPQEIMDDLARLKIELVGLAPEAADKFPSELSGGMIKRAALARALALDPDLVFLDEPTSGLDPIGAAEFDELIARLRDTLGLTVYMVTHDLDSLFSVCDRIAVLGNKKVMVEGTIEDMLASDDDWVQSYFRGKRARSIVRDDGEDLRHHDANAPQRHENDTSGDRPGNRQGNPQGNRQGNPQGSQQNGRAG